MPPPDSRRRRGGPVPTGRVADPDGGGHRLGVLDRVAGHDGRGARGLEPEHARQPGGPARLLVLEVALPVGGDVAGVAHRDAVDVGGVAERVDDLEGPGLLALDPVGVHRVDHGDRGPLAQLPDDGRGPRRSCPAPGGPGPRGSSAWASLPRAMWPSGMSTAQVSPARAAKAAAEADVLPVDAHTTALAPSSAALEMATVMPRSLNEPVGLAPSTFKQDPGADPRGQPGGGEQRGAPLEQRDHRGGRGDRAGTRGTPR